LCIAGESECSIGHPITPASLVLPETSVTTLAPFALRCGRRPSERLAPRKYSPLHRAQQSRVREVRPSAEWFDEHSRRADKAAAEHIREDLIAYRRSLGWTSA
jgi:hypothetical protein